MNSQIKFSALSVAILLTFSACGSSPKPIYVGEGTSKPSPVTLGIDRSDFENAATRAVENLLASNALNKPGGGRYVVAIDKIINDTTQRIDTDLLIKKIRIAMLNSGKAVVSAAIKVGGPESTLSHSVRELRDDIEVNQKTIAKKGSIIAPDMGLSGKIIQRNIKVGNSKQKVEYYFQLSLANLETGLVFWEYEKVVEKLGSNDTVTW